MNIAFNQFRVTKLDGTEVDLGFCVDKVVLVVNTASRCGYTYQYAGLEKLYQTYAERGFVILGFPCNQFANQEPGNAQQIADFCQTNYGVSFSMFAKILVNGKAAHPLYQALKVAAPGVWGTQAIKWNFTKFLINRQGQVVQRFAPLIRPEQLIPYIEQWL
jgi:glutathione peroxidase